MGESGVKVYDVAVVGGGIIGMVAARCFACCGQSVILLEKSRTNKVSPSKDSKGCFPVSLRVSNWEFLEQIGLTGASGGEQLIRELHLSSKNIFGTARVQEADASPIAHVVRIDKLASEIREKIYEDAQITVCEEAEISDFRRDNSVLELSNGGHTWQAKRCVIADGSNSPVSELLQIPKKGYPKLIESFIIAIKADNWKKEAAYIRQDESVIYGVVPQAQGQGWVIVTRVLNVMGADDEQDAGDMQSDEYWQERLNQVFSTRLGNVGISGAIVKQKSMLQSRPVSHVPWVISLGNAALQVPPIGAQGLNMALQDCQDMFHLQQICSWHTQSPIAWQDQFSAKCQYRHDQWYQKIQTLVGHLSRYGQLDQIKSRLAWMLLGIDGTLQDQLESVGQGRG